MTMRDSGWKYYLPEEGQSSDDATVIWLAEWEHVFDADNAATHAAVEEWDSGGWESGTNATPVIAIIAPDGTETRWQITREPAVNHYATEIEI